MRVALSAVLLIGIAASCASRHDAVEPVAPPIERSVVAATSSTAAPVDRSASTELPSTIAETIDAPASTPPTTNPHIDGPLRKVDTPGEHMTAALPGTLAIVDGCVVQASPGSDSSTLVVWPLEVTWDPEAQAIIFPDGTVLAIGDTAQIGGGFVPIGDLAGGYWPDGEAAVAAIETCSPGITTIYIAGGDFAPYRSFDLYTHCGIRGTMIDGLWWEAVRQLDDGNGNPPKGWGNPTQSGTLTFYDDIAVFATEQGLRARFTPTTLTSPPFVCS
jgi:hypothetical protein